MMRLMPLERKAATEDSIEPPRAAREPVVH